MYEERALLLGRIARHDQALAIYVYQLRDYEMAEEYCRRVYNRDREDTRDVYMSLLRTFLAPISGTPPMIERALHLLARYHASMDIAKALEMLPLGTRLDGLLPFLESVFRGVVGERQDAQVLCSIYKMDDLLVQLELMLLRSQFAVITPERVCPVCRRRIGNSAFARYQDGVIVHLGCKDRTSNAT